MTTDHAAAYNNEEGQTKQRMRCKLAAAKEYLGKNHVLHPDYKFEENMQHSPQHKRSYSLSNIRERALWAGRI